MDNTTSHSDRIVTVLNKRLKQTITLMKQNTELRAQVSKLTGYKRREEHIARVLECFLQDIRERYGVNAEGLLKCDNEDLRREFFMGERMLEDYKRVGGQ